MDLEKSLADLLANYPILVYFAIALIGFLEGPILSILCGIFFRLGFFDIVPLYLALGIGDLAGDFLWYYVGYRFGHKFIRKFGKYFSVHEKNVTTVIRIFQSYRNSILFISKLTMGLGFSIVTLVTAGMSKIPFMRYAVINASGQIVWTGLLLFIGYAFGHLYASFDGIISRISLIGLLIIVICLMFGFARYIRQELTEKSS